MNEIKIFENSQFGTIRTAGTSEAPLFCAMDICKALGYTNGRKAVADHCDDEDVTKRDTLTAGGRQSITFVNISGLYSLVLSSKLEGARQFKRWVTSEVLPSIQRTGHYSLATLSRKELAQMIIQSEEENERLALQLKDSEKEVMTLTRQIEEAQPKVAYYDMILNNKSTVLTTQIAQDYGMSAKRLNCILKEMHIQHKVNDQWILYAKYQGEGYVSSKPVQIQRTNGQTVIKYNTEWTQKGRLFLYDKLKSYDILPLIEK